MTCLLTFLALFNITACNVYYLYLFVRKKHLIFSVVRNITIRFLWLRNRTMFSTWVLSILIREAQLRWDLLRYFAEMPLCVSQSPPRLIHFRMITWEWLNGSLWKCYQCCVISCGVIINWVYFPYWLILSNGCSSMTIKPSIQTIYNTKT